MANNIIEENISRVQAENAICAAYKRLVKIRNCADYDKVLEPIINQLEDILQHLK